MTTVPTSNVRYNNHPECEAAINDQIILELYAAYVYESMASYFNSQEEVALKQFTEFFLQQSSKEREHAHRLIELQNLRRGRLPLLEKSRPDPSCWKNGLQAMECALLLETTVTESLLDLHQLATEKRDVHVCDFQDRHYLFQQMKFIQELGEHIANLSPMGAPESGLAEDLCAKLTLGDSDKKN